jgi:hypothetical protein
MEIDREVPCIYGPVAVALSNGGLEVFAIGKDNQLYHLWTDPDPYHWGNDGQWAALGQQQSFKSSPVAVALSNGGLEVFAIRQDNYLCHIWTTGPGKWNPNGWMTVGQQIPFVGSLAAVRWAGDNIQVFAIGSDNYLYHLWTNAPGQWNPNGWMTVGQQIPFAAGPTAVEWTVDGNIQIFAIGKDNQLYHLWTDPDPYHWGNDGQWAALGQQIPFAAGPTAVEWTVDG